MLFRRIDAISRFITTSYNFSTRTKSSNPPKPFAKIPWKHRSKIIEESQKTLTDYLHTTRYLPFSYADHISRNCPNSLWEIVSKISPLPATFGSCFKRFLRYHPINEVDFFLESIGLGEDGNGLPPSLLPGNIFFLSDWKYFNVACDFAAIGFPWSKLGIFFKDECLIFENYPSGLQRKINAIKDGYGFNSVAVIGICLAFPEVLHGKMDGLLSDLKILFLDHDLLSSIDGNSDAVLEVCEKIKLFYDLGCEMGKVGDLNHLMLRSKHIFIEYSKEYLSSKIAYFCKLGIRKDQIAMFLLSSPEIFGFDLEDRIISVSGILQTLGCEENELRSLEQKYPYIFGRNKIANLPHIMRSIDLEEWFFEKMKNGGYHLLGTYAILSEDEGLDNYYIEGIRKIRAKRTFDYSIEKLNFLHSIGFGENRFTVKALAQLNSNSGNLQQRFDCFLRYGIKYSKLCAMLKMSGRILNQNSSIIEKKLEYLCTNMGLSLQYLDVFPGYLCFDFEKRIKPRYELHKWLVEQGFCVKDYSMATMIATSDKTFIARVSRIHPPAAKNWIISSLKTDSSARFKKKTVP